MKDLTIRAARARLKKLAKGRYRTVRKEWTDRKDYVTDKDITDTECGLYIDGTTFVTRPTFRDAFEEIERQMEAWKT